MTLTTTITTEATKLDTTPAWKDISAKKIEALNSSIPQEWRIPQDLLPPADQADVTTWPEASGWFTNDELAITSLTAAELLNKLVSGALKSEDVTRAFCKRAAAAHQLTNCLAETCFDRAIQTARHCDEHLSKTGTPIGPLHGLPISLKDNFNLEGLDATVGFTSHVGDPASADSALATLLQNAGAVFYVKTNVPTAMMIAESVNNTFGRTVNPKNRNTTSGGSSGGESALIAFKGSPLGVGTDIGGSLRIPAACTGLFTLRPSSGRFPVRNCRSGMPGQEAVQSVNGPLGRTLQDIQLYSKAVIDSQPWLADPKCLPIPWRPAQLPSKLKIAFMWHDGMVLPTPPVIRALRIAKERLEAAGHTIVEWDPVDQREGGELLQRMFLADGGQTIRKELERTDEPWRPEMAAYSTARDLSTSEMWRLHLERTAFQNKYLDRWNKAGIDAIICPTTPYSTGKNGSLKHVAYTGVFNVVDYSAVSFPTGVTVDKDGDLLDPSYSPLSPLCKTVSEDYDAELVHGLPVSLQIVARRLEEEKVLAMANLVHETMK
ncbi:amidase signature domain-containing protein [Fusarium flagelliforme]|uniref:amidase signature domain-containing protein n=1 Tax=Fusarium flagelliforme TaxID=2675880 RepID=UPI001E8D84A3|nr:amidase signature domain-containing protein [Fusarium flagelliforme]KAH7193681.1 amidase signature domain-containing protein [Fusarium flagelliforme]